MPTRRLPSLFVLPVVAFVLAGCGREDIRVTTVPKTQALPAAQTPAADSGGAETLHWSVPAGWKQNPAGGMRAASYSVPGPGGEADMSVVLLPGPAGGILPNVNRWRGQIGLDEWDAGELTAQSRVLETPAGPVTTVDFSNKGKRLRAGLLDRDGQTWFFKMTGPEGVVASAVSGFDELLRSLHHASH